MWKRKQRGMERLWVASQPWSQTLSLDWRRAPLSTPMGWVMAPPARASQSPQCWTHLSQKQVSLYVVSSSIFKFTVSFSSFKLSLTSLTRLKVNFSLGLNPPPTVWLFVMYPSSCCLQSAWSHIIFSLLILQASNSATPYLFLSSFIFTSFHSSPFPFL